MVFGKFHVHQSKVCLPGEFLLHPFGEGEGQRLRLDPGFALQIVGIDCGLDVAVHLHHGFWKNMV